MFPDAAGGCDVPAYRFRMPPTRASGRGRDLDRWVAAAETGGRLAATALAAFASANTRDPHAALRKAYSQQLAGYHRRKAALQARVVTGATVAGTGAVGTVAAVGVGQGLTAVVIGGVSAGVAAWGARGWRRLRAFPGPPPAPPEPLPRLGPGTPGADAIARLNRAEINLADLVPAVTRVHPGAADELRAAAEAATPALHDLADRLAVLERLRGGSGEPAAAADIAARTVATRLAEGVTAYERLIAAAAALLAAPDPGSSVADLVDPAVQGLAAYTLGLGRADDLLRGPRDLRP